MNDDATALIHAYLDGELTDRQRRSWAIGCVKARATSIVSWPNAACTANCSMHRAGDGRRLSRQTNRELSAVSRLPPTIRRPSPRLPRLSYRILPISISSFSPLGGFLFSYVAAAMIVAVGMLIGWAYQVSIPRSDRPKLSRLPSGPRRRTSTRSPKSFLSAASPAWSIAHGPIPRPEPFLRVRSLGPEIRPGLRSDGNHLRHRRQSYPRRAVCL